MSLRLVHFTDLHYTLPPRKIPKSKLCSKRILGYLNLTLRGRYDAFAETSKVVRAFVRDLSDGAGAEADAIVFTGDVTGLSLEDEFRAAAEDLKPLLDDPRVIGIPGNHDVYVRAAARQGHFERWFGAWLKTDFAADRFPADARESYPFPLVRLLGEEAVLLCLRDVRPAALWDSSGKVDDAQLRALEHILRLDELGSRTRILALHYAPLRADGSPDRFSHRLRNADTVMKLAASHGVSLIVHGHLHDRFVHPEGGRSAVPIANPGSLSYENQDRAYHVLTVDGGRIGLQARRYDSAEDRFVDWPDAPSSGIIVSGGRDA